tara:strand:+ start:7732 stop:7968 length:237 start_codon:yes stop_codon:yes gene_type:complete
LSNPTSQVFTDDPFTRVNPEDARTLGQGPTLFIDHIEAIIVRTHTLNLMLELNNLDLRDGRLCHVLLLVWDRVGAQAL